MSNDEFEFIPKNKENKYYAGRAKTFLFNEQNEIIGTAIIDIPNFYLDKYGIIIEDIENEVKE